MSNWLEKLGGDPGANAFSIVASAFVQPAVGANVTIVVDDTNWIPVGVKAFLAVAGACTVVSVNSATSVTIKNAGGGSNATAGTTIPAGGRMAAAGDGVPGATGAAGAAGATGPAGTVGPAGPAGAPGASGAPGANGVNGTNGTSYPAPATPADNGKLAVASAGTVVYGPQTGHLYSTSADAVGAGFVGHKRRAAAAHAAGDSLVELASKGYDGAAEYDAGRVRVVADAAGGTSKRTRVEVTAHDGSAEVVLSKTVPLTPLTTAGATPTAIASVAVPASTLLSLGFRVRGKDGAGNEVFREWTLVVRRIGSANVTSLGTSDLISFRDDVAAGLPSIAINATTIDVLVTGKAATSYTWTGEINWREMP